jgi:type VII secretion protein EccB
MQTKRDQLQAHNFVVSRLRSALLHGDADALETPTRRFSVAAFAGVLVGGLIVAACGVYGLFFPGGNDTWRSPGAIIVEKETGIRYLYDPDSQTLHPALNYASARLIVGAAATVRTVSAKSLAGVRHGPALGIAGAPDALPTPAQLSTDPWLTCATNVPGPGGDSRTLVTAVLGRPDAATAVPSGQAALVSTTAGDQHLIWNSTRLKIADPTATVVFGLDAVRPTQVPDTWLNAIPAGPDLRPPQLSGRGDPGPDIDGRPTRVGQILLISTAAAGAGEDFRLVLADGLLAAPPTVAELTLADPANRASYDGDPAAIKVSSAGVVSAPRSTAELNFADLPQRPPPLLAPTEVGGRSLCARTTFGPARHELVLADVAGLPVSVPRARGADSPATDSRAADQVSVPAGRGVLARADSGPPNGALCLITDLGLAFPVSPDAVTALGYGAVTPVSVPATLLALIPRGPTLDPAAAGGFAPVP